MCETYLSFFPFIKRIAWEKQVGGQTGIPQIILNLFDLIGSR